MARIVQPRTLIKVVAAILPLLLAGSFVSSTADELEDASSQCGFYLAPSTIPGAGLGAFAGKSYNEDTIVTLGDIVIPIFEMRRHYGNDFVGDKRAFLFDDYVWSHTAFAGMEDEEIESEEIYAFSPGLGAIPNGVTCLANMQDYDTGNLDSAGIHRASDPGAGAFTPYHNRTFMTKSNIVEGAEIFFDYGEAYFKTRDAFKLVPLKADYERADGLLKKYTHLQEKVNHSSLLLGKLWNLTTSFPWESRTMSALPSNHSQIDQILEQNGTAKQFYEHSFRDLDWLEQHGQCMDNMRPGQSTIPQAGRGAFANRRIVKGGLVAPAPLLHIPDRRRFAMYDTWLDGKEERTFDETPIHQQLILNYCFGHRFSTLLLCPYGPLTSLINHSQKNPNTRIQWSSDKTMRYPEWRSMPVWDLEQEAHAGLAFDFVAIRDIDEGEEILIDYGEEWEAAWQQHVSNWETPSGAQSYMAAFELNQDVDLVVKTVEEGTYSSGIQQHCHEVYRLMNGLSKTNQDLHYCRAIQRYSRHNETLYTAEIFTLVDDEHSKITTLQVKEVLFDLPRNAFAFTDVPYTRDHHMTWSFRHEMMIPDDMFPWTWKNRKVYCFLWSLAVRLWQELMNRVETYVPESFGRFATVSH